MFASMLKILMLVYIQNISFSIVSRSRNRDNIKYHLIAATFSNSIWFLTFRELVVSDMNWLLFIPYVIGTVIGSITGVKVSMWIEKLIGATSDGHLNKTFGPISNQPKDIQVRRFLGYKFRRPKK